MTSKGFSFILHAAVSTFLALIFSPLERSHLGDSGMKNHITIQGVPARGITNSKVSMFLQP